MQVKLNKVRITDTRSAFHDKLVDLVIDNHIISDIKPLKKAAGKEGSSITVGNKVKWTGANGEILNVSPGWVDVFADYREPGYEHKETIATGLAAAAAGGFTDVFVLPNTQPAISNKGQVQFMLQQAAGHAVTLYPMGAISADVEGKTLAEMLDMRDNGAIAFTDGWKPVQNANLMMKALEYVKAFDGTIVQLPVDAALAAGGLMHEGIVSTTLGIPGIPALAETLAIYRDIELARYTNSKLHITGVSTADSVALVRKAKADGLSVTCSVTPYHLALTDDMMNTYDSAYKVSPPLRTETDRMALIDALADGTIDCICSHHRPQEWDAKTKELDYAADGMAIQETAYNIVWDTLRDYIGTDRLVEVMSTSARTIFGLDEAQIEKGGTAALTLYSTDGNHTLTAANKKSIAYNQPFLNELMAGKVSGIINNAQIILNK